MVSASHKEGQVPKKQLCLRFTEGAEQGREGQQTLEERKQGTGGTGGLRRKGASEVAETKGGEEQGTREERKEQ